ncbi:MAG: DUF3052 domain-containing protein [Gilvibacter sp.]
MKNAGYSGTPLAKKLGIKDGDSIQVFNSPKNYIDFFFDFPKNAKIVEQGKSMPEIDFIHIFSRNKSELTTHFSLAKPNLKKSGILWLSWPKKSSKIETELDKFTILNFGLDNGLVDTKVAAIDIDWSGHKFMYRKKDR